MNQSPEHLPLEEFRSLRSTIRDRGTLRLAVTAVTFIAWAMLFLFGWPAISNFPPASLVPLLVLAAGFEVVFSAHVAAERIGRYLALTYEPAVGLPHWEHAVLRFSAPGATAPLDPLNVKLFLLAAAINALPMLLARLPAGGVDVWVFPAVLTLAHALFVARLFQASGFARDQRRRDTEALSDASR